MEPPIQRDTFPAIEFISRHGAVLVGMIALIPAAGGILAVVDGQSWWWAPAGLLAGGLGCVLMKSYCELVKVVATTLIPDR